MIKPQPCARCQALIPVERLEALPETRLCIQCSAAIGSDFEVTVVRENIGKAGSLKKNYGSFSIKKTRRRIEPIEE